MTDKRFDPDWVIAPGETLKEWREENKLGVKAAATTCARMSVDLYTAIEAGEQPITDTIADALHFGTGIPKRLWLNLERIYREGLKAGKTRV
ncbi:transcriptional regulator [Candidatus Solirubrobacter pratensis]|uniref:transcriptional regulator n=1 Tax=Candidatus Solirubrobacter pratensis TaxID=1298857 RepID=UPI0003FD3572|nr:transcriptional regulator [Candidatus Solirubrobacter pratensis]